ncbi:MAG: N-acetylneuraminate synthase [Candidatus Omnitrophica bacterium]|nr:N-acetylneuraminate synthase [Candidatus Omnitrophota bacterium]
MEESVHQVEIAGHRIGPRRPCFIIAEAGVNHNGDLDLARRLVEVAARCGADAVKFQTFKTERLSTPKAPKAGYQLRAASASESQFEMLRRLELSAAAHRELMDHCQRQGLLFMSTPFDEESADFLYDLGVPAFKIPSGEITNLPFLAHVGRKGRPMIVSTGMSNLEEVSAAVRTIEEAGNRDLILLHCVSDYPANPADANLRAMGTMSETFRVPVGYSDHTLGIEVAMAAVALGACVIEKHFTLDRRLPGPDHGASLEPEGLASLVRGIRTVEVSLGHGRKEPVASEAEVALVARKSIVSVKDIRAGTTLTEDLITFKRPGTGLPPSMLKSVVGRLAAKDIPSDTVITLEMLK